MVAVVDESSLTEPQRAWVEALRSGKYKQGQGALRYDDRFCCLGVACELAVQRGVIGHPEPHGGEYAYDGDAISYPPDAVTEWLGLGSSAGTFRDWSLTRLNDAGETFERIADIIESQPAGLFVDQRVRDFEVLADAARTPYPPTEAA